MHLSPFFVSLSTFSALLLPSFTFLPSPCGCNARNPSLLLDVPLLGRVVAGWELRTLFHEFAFPFSRLHPIRVLPPFEAQSIVV